jgi:hypothetical protein
MTPNSSILAKPVSMDDYLRHQEKVGRAPPGITNFLMRCDAPYAPQPGDFFRASDGRMWRRSHDLRWDVSDE